MSNLYGATALTGGGTKALDGSTYYDGDDLVDGDGAIVITSSSVYAFHLDAASGAAENSPLVISPDANAGTKRWILKKGVFKELFVYNILEVHQQVDESYAEILLTDDNNRTLFLRSPQYAASSLIPAIISIAGTASSLQIGTRDFPTAIIISGISGKVGFGTILPLSDIDVSISHGLNKERTITAESISGANRYGLGFKYWTDGSGVTFKTITEYHGESEYQSIVLKDSKVGINDLDPASQLDVAGDVNTTVDYKVDDVKVVGNRVIDVRCDDAINSGDGTTDGVIDALRDAMITHGLIAAA